MYLKGARRMCILGGDTVAGDAFGVGASGLADCQYEKHFRCMEEQARCVPFDRLRTRFGYPAEI
jgi:hypothetical protein